MMSAGGYFPRMPLSIFGSACFTQSLIPRSSSCLTISATFAGAFGSVIRVLFRNPTLPKFSVLLFFPSISSRWASAKAQICASSRFVPSR